VLLAALAPSPVAATSLTPGTIVDVHFNGVGVPYTIGIHEGSFQGTVYADPYSLSVNSMEAILAMCFDAGARVSPPTDWKALVATIDDVAEYYYGGDTQKALLLAYLNALWPAASRETQAFVGAAMWEVTADFAGSLATLDVASGAGTFWLLDQPAGSTAATQAILNAAYEAVVTHGWAPGDGGIYLLAVSTSGSTPAAGTEYGDSGLYFTVDRSVQPFATNVPEPSTLLLLVIGAGAAVVRGRRRRAA
jgi:hypothetical protein